ncbi:HET-domain-containing protein [Ganoderma leucocontextum]|nr:HET-domain-containing protein [Ganoderma leucocontextum]
MRLLDTHTGRFVEVHDPNSVEYAILSHTWDPTGEQSYHDVRRIHASPYLQIVAVIVWVGLAVWWRLLLALSVVLEAPIFLTHSMLRSQKDEEIRLVLPSAFRTTESSRGHVTVGVVQRLRRAAEDIRSWNSYRFSTRLSAKIRRACATARAYGHRLVWIDSCCIDKTSSSELSEAINSMYTWYRGATICYAFLADVPSSPSRAALDNRSWSSTVAFRKSRWFRRGWTLQELIAPRVVVFLSMEWQFLGTKSSLAQVIEEVTGIYSAVLRHQMPLSEVPVAKRMSWAAMRETTRKEDEAYSLLGIFDISMSTLYGEGARAFIRLQEKILKRIPDQSLFAWTVSDQEVHSLQFPLTPKVVKENSYVMDAIEDDYSAFFAASPRSFRNSNGIRPLSHSAFVERIGFNSPLPTYTVSPYGIHTHFPLIPANHCFPPGLLTPTNCYFAILACELEDQEGSLLAVVCSAEPTAGGTMLLKSGRITEMTNRKLLHRTTTIHYNRMSEHRIGVFDSAILPELFPLSRKLYVDASPVYVPVENPLPSSRAWYAWTGSVQLTAWSTTILRQLGYAVSSSTDSDSSHMLSLAMGDTRLNIRHRRSRPQDPNDPFVVVWVAPSSVNAVCRPAVGHARPPQDPRLQGVRIRRRLGAARRAALHIVVHVHIVLPGRGGLGRDNRSVSC